MSYKDVVEKRKASTIIDLILNSTNVDGRELYYRGQNGIYEAIVPNLYREEELSMKGSEFYYRNLIAELGRDDYNSGSSLVRLLSELQHYGAKTRMLDVTRNPLIALYFAVEQDEDANDGYVFIYSPEKEDIIFDTGHTSAIKAAMNLIPRDYVNDFFKTCKDLLSRDGVNEFSHIEELKYDAYKKQSGLINKSEYFSVMRFMEYLNQRAREKERLVYPYCVYNDLKRAHLIIPSKCTDRIKQQQGFFIYPSFPSTDKSYEEVKKEVSESIEKMLYTLEYTDDKKNVIRFSAIKVPYYCKSDVKKELGKLGITAGVVYPDIQHNSEAILQKTLSKGVH